MTLALCERIHSMLHPLPMIPLPLPLVEFERPGNANWYSEPPSGGWTLTQLLNAFYTKGHKGTRSV